MGQSRRYAGASTEDGEQRVPEKTVGEAAGGIETEDGIGGEMGLEHVREKGKKGSVREDYMQRM